MRSCSTFVYGLSEIITRGEMEKEFGRCGSVTDQVHVFMAEEALENMEEEAVDMKEEEVTEKHMFLRSQRNI